MIGLGEAKRCPFQVKLFMPNTFLQCCHMSSYVHRHHSNLSSDAGMVSNKQEDLGDERTSGGKKLKIITVKTCINVIQVHESVSGAIENAPLPPTNSS